jgi:F-type H+-transporting ATPase subunit b
MEQFAHQFGIDWKIMLAQLINFAVVFFVLKKFAYKPILNLLDARKKKIEDGLTFAEKAKNELASIEVIKGEEIVKAQKQGMEIVKASEVSAAKVRDEIVAGGEVEKQKLVATGKALVAEQKNRMEKDVYAQAVSLVETALGKVLGKSEFKSEEKQLISQAVSEISVK